MLSNFIKTKNGNSNFNILYIMYISVKLNKITLYKFKLLIRILKKNITLKYYRIIICYTTPLPHTSHEPIIFIICQCSLQYYSYNLWVKITVAASLCNYIVIMAHICAVFRWNNSTD